MHPKNPNWNIGHDSRKLSQPTLAWWIKPNTSKAKHQIMFGQILSKYATCPYHETKKMMLYTSCETLLRGKQYFSLIKA